MIKKKLKFKYFCILICVFAFCILHFAFCSAAVLYLEPVKGQYYQGDTFLVEIRIDTQGEYINAVDVGLEYSQGILEAKDFSKGNSILTLWVEKPEFSNKNISFAAGIPGGYQGSDGLLAKIAFRVNEIGLAQISFEQGSKILLNEKR